MTLFIVPWPWAGTGTACPKARKSRSTIRLEVSTFPAATAAGETALTRQPAGARTETGSIAPAEAGTSGSVRQRTTKRQAETVTASGQLRLPSCCGAVPAKSISSSSPATVTAARSSSSPSAVSSRSTAS
jgi:hypothetical protein